MFLLFEYSHVFRVTVSLRMRHIYSVVLQTLQPLTYRIIFFQVLQKVLSFLKTFSIRALHLKKNLSCMVILHKGYVEKENNRSQNICSISLVYIQKIIQPQSLTQRLETMIFSTQVFVGRR